MVKITHTNIIVDEFSTARNNPFNKYVHFLTHIHADHLKGLSNSWDYGIIYCSSITKQLLLLKFPRLKCLKELQLDKQYSIALSSQLEVTVTMFDSNHCAGSVMLLMEGYMGTVFYTGDMRFDREVFGDYSYLYPHNKRNKEFRRCSIDIDFLYLDTTFLHPKFSFPPKSQALKQLDEFIQSTISKAKETDKFIQFYVGIDSFGKQEVLVHLAEKFSTFITVSEERYKSISTIGLDSDCFTTDPQAGFVHVVLKRELKQLMAAKENSMGVILTGWANRAHSRSAKTYAIPYSLHSSYPELVAFVDSIQPCFIQSILQMSQGSFSRPSQQHSNNNSMKNMEDIELYEEVNTSEYLNKLRNEYTSKPSAELRQLLSNIEFQKKIKEKLKLDRTSVEINREEFGMTTNIIRVESISRAGAKLSGERNEELIEKIKEQIKNKKHTAKTKAFQEVSTKRIISTNMDNKEKKNIITQKTPLQIEDSQEFQQFHLTEKEIEEKSNSEKNSSNNSSKQNCSKNHPPKHQEDSHATRRNKWKKQLEQGEIDLFGNIPIKTAVTHNRLSNTNPHAKAKTTNKNINDSYIDVIELSDEVEEQTNKKSLQSGTRKGKNSTKNQRINEKKEINISADEIVLPAEREPDQRSIFEFFKQPKGQQQAMNTKNISNIQLKPPQDENNQKDVKPKENDKPQQDVKQIGAGDKEESSLMNNFMEEEKQLSVGQKILKNWKQFSVFGVNMARVNEIKEAPVESYKNFFLSNRL